MYKVQWCLLEILANTKSCRKIHVYPRLLAAIFRYVKKSVLKSWNGYQFCAKPPTASPFYRKAKRCFWYRRTFFFSCRRARLLEVLQEINFHFSIVSKCSQVAAHECEDINVEVSVIINKLSLSKYLKSAI